MEYFNVILKRIIDKRVKLIFLLTSKGNYFITSSTKVLKIKFNKPEHIPLQI